MECITNTWTINQKKRKSNTIEANTSTSTTINTKKQKTCEDLANIKNQLSEKNVKLQAAQKLVNEATNKLTEASSAKNITKKTILEARSMLEMGLSTSTTVQSEINTLLLEERQLLERKK